MGAYGNSMNGRRNPMGSAAPTTTPSAAARPRPAGTVIPAMTAASGARTPHGREAPTIPGPRRPGAAATTSTYGGRHAYVQQLQDEIDAAKAQAEAHARAQEVPDQVVTEMFGGVEPEVNLDEVGALLEEADALLEDLEQSTAG